MRPERRDGRTRFPGDSRLHRAGLLVAVLVALPCPAIAQQVVIEGRVEDAVSLRPLVDVRVVLADSSAAAVTDATGVFRLVAPAPGPVTLVVERLGYETSVFELPGELPASLFVLRLEPAPIELEEINVVAESAVTEVLEDLESRRRAYAGMVTAFDRTALERLAPVGTVWDFVRRRAFALYQCGTSWSGLCSRQRGRRSIAAPREAPVSVCIDGRTSYGAVSELSSLDIESVALVEIYAWGRGGVRIYTPGYIATSARRGRNIASPVGFGC